MHINTSLIELNEFNINSIIGIPHIGSKRQGVSKVKGSNKDVKVSPIITAFASL